MTEERKQQTNIVNRIKKLLLNYDLSIVYAKSEIERCSSEMRLYETSLHSSKKNSYRKQRFLEAKVSKQKMEIYLQDLEREKKELRDSLDSVLNNYLPLHAKIIKMYFFEQATYQQISDATHYQSTRITEIITKFKEDILNYYFD